MMLTDGLPPEPPQCPDCKQQVTTMMVFPDGTPPVVSPCGHTVVNREQAQQIADRFHEMMEVQRPAADAVVA